MSKTIARARIFGVVNLFLRLFLGGMLLLGGVSKFDKPMPLATSQIEQVKKGTLTTENVEVLKMENYLFGMKQTNYFWQFLGAVDILFGLLIVSQVFGLLGEIMALPITINIFLFHLFLERNEIAELVEVSLILAVNIWLIAYEYNRWKGIVFKKQIFN
ncbi:DoxX family membrane protein [Flavobacterium psychrophilum]|uniref:DoxX family membrane protein n=1 Tax=Flavobacterium psychrophilum TaxID=96345 RepID=UPI001C8F588C|nr:DoxX family membrane protein [Flavobacterium psychrophilum]EKT4499381.1 DoxX family membrane protein [Flavobacterium psychrophilum]ELM3650419.1 DoxX family membrane protein [Flavobacterium psychrophilum]ELM3671598.1 DoxX family membrane protein [Flavobacterium psychrophilum]ELM3725738.1 DoxX family membrane protein [Flavobacterium psychrophilum]ELY1991530.1 DoxX family membrane protein [Flavobacterium psychrophilum]